MKVSESKTECVCGYQGDHPDQCQCQYGDWPETENKHQSCDFCMEKPVYVSINDGLWWICRDCYVSHYGGEEE